MPPETALWALALVGERALSGLAVAAFPLAKNTGLAHTFATAADRTTVRRVLMVLAALLSAALLALEYQKGRPIQRQLQLVGAAEAFHLLFVLLTVYGGMAGLSFWANLLWVLLACARGWAALVLYKTQEETL